MPPTPSKKAPRAAAKKKTEQWAKVNTLPTDPIKPPATLIPSGKPKPSPKRAGETQQQYLKRMIKERGATSA
jgi:hypothetical protein